MKRLLKRIAAFAVFFLLLAAFAAPRLGGWLVAEQPLQKADAILVLGGTRFERPLEAVDLYKEGWAPRVLLLRQISDAGEILLQARGVPFMREIDVQIDVMRQLGVPRTAIQILDEANSTKDEADLLRDLVLANRWSRVIIVTSKQHTRRAGLVMRRRLEPVGAQPIMRSSRYDPSNVDAWWRERSTLRFTLFETQRLIAYWLHLAD